MSSKTAKKILCSPVEKLINYQAKKILKQIKPCKTKKGKSSENKSNDVRTTTKSKIDKKNVGKSNSEKERDDILKHIVVHITKAMHLEAHCLCLWVDSDADDKNVKEDSMKKTNNEDTRHCFTAKDFCKDQAKSLIESMQDMTEFVIDQKDSFNIEKAKDGEGSSSQDDYFRSFALFVEFMFQRQSLMMQNQADICHSYYMKYNENSAEDGACSAFLLNEILSKMAQYYHEVAVVLQDRFQEFDHGFSVIQFFAEEYDHRACTLEDVVTKARALTKKTCTDYKQDKEKRRVEFLFCKYSELCAKLSNFVSKCSPSKVNMDNTGLTPEMLLNQISLSPKEDMRVHNADDHLLQSDEWTISTAMSESSSFESSKNGTRNSKSEIGHCITIMDDKALDACGESNDGYGLIM